MSCYSPHVQRLGLAECEALEDEVDEVEQPEHELCPDVRAGIRGLQQPVEGEREEGG